MAKRKLRATLPDGSIVTRTTERTYTHVVAKSYNKADGSTEWVATNWCGSIRLAQNKARLGDVIVPVNNG